MRREALGEIAQLRRLIALRDLLSLERALEPPHLIVALARALPVARGGAIFERGQRVVPQPVGEPRRRRLRLRVEIRACVRFQPARPAEPEAPRLAERVRAARAE